MTTLRDRDQSPPPRERPVILVDQDGVIADWGAGFDTLFAELYPGLSFRTHPQRIEWAAAGQDPLVQQATAAVMNHPRFFLDMPPVPGARDSLNDMAAAGYNVFICTAPWLTHPSCASDKLTWIAKHFGDQWVERTIITTDKTLVRGKFLFDDRDAVTGSLSPTWTHIVVDQPYNVDVQRPRVRSILEWRTAIDRLSGVPHEGES